MEGSTGAKLNPDYSTTNSSLQRDRETLAATPRDRTTGAASRVPRLSALALNWARHAARAACGRGARRDRSTRPRPCHIPHARAPRRGGCERARGLFGAGAWRDAYRTMDMAAPSVAARGVLRLRIQLTEILVLARVFLACCLYTVLVRT